MCCTTCQDPDLRYIQTLVNYDDVGANFFPTNTNNLLFPVVPLQHCALRLQLTL